MGQDDPIGWLDFIASLVGSVAWPLAAVVIAALFRSQIEGRTLPKSGGNLRPQTTSTPITMSSGI
jgi:hypothetical protein